jgi:hypothetical protein
MCSGLGVEHMTQEEAKRVCQSDPVCQSFSRHFTFDKSNPAMFNIAQTTSVGQHRLSSKPKSTMTRGGTTNVVAR